MAGPEFLSQLPSIEELLENPRVKAAVDRVNVSTAAARVRRAVTSLTAEVTRRAESLQNLAPNELLERLLRQLDHPRAPAAAKVLNATGQLLGDPWTGAPLASVAVEAAAAAAESFRPAASGAASASASSLLKAERACVATSHVAAIGALLESLAGGGGACLVARSEMTELAPGVRLDDLCRRTGVRLREVGATDSASLDDYRRAIGEESSAGGTPPLVLRRCAIGAVGVEVSDLASLTREHGLTLAADAAWLRPRADTPGYSPDSASAETLLSSGADAVVLDAAGLVGGPVAGVVAGKSAAVDRVAQAVASRGETVASLTDAALTATLELFHQPATLRFTHPLYQLLDTPLENLQTRAERIAGRLSGAATVHSAEACQVPPARPAVCAAASWAVKVVPAESTPEALAGRLRRSDPAIHARVGAGAVWLDLRGVAPREDALLVSAVAPEAALNVGKAGGSDG